MASRWAGKGVHARRRDEAVFEYYGEERQRRRHALSGPAEPAQNRAICVVAPAQWVYGPGFRPRSWHLARFCAAVRPLGFQTEPSAGQISTSHLAPNAALAAIAPTSGIS